MRSRGPSELFYPESLYLLSNQICLPRSHKHKMSSPNYEQHEDHGGSATRTENNESSHASNQDGVGSLDDKDKSSGDTNNDEEQQYSSMAPYVSRVLHRSEI